MREKTCPKCGGELTVELIDIGVCNQEHVYCNNCGWEESDDIDELFKRTQTRGGTDRPERIG